MSSFDKLTSFDFICVTVRWKELALTSDIESESVLAELISNIYFNESSNQEVSPTSMAVSQVTYLVCLILQSWVTAW